MAKSKHWLNEQLGEYDIQQGVFKRQATVCWAAALRFEIEASHGKTSYDQITSCRLHFANEAIKPAPIDRTGEVFCGLFHSLTSATTLVSLEESETSRFWMYPSSVVTWYYAHYHAMRSIALARNLQVKDSHQSLYGSMNGIMRRCLPHPYDIRGGYDSSGVLGAELPRAPGTVFSSPVKDFDESSDMARGVLLHYVKGTAEKAKEKAKSEISKGNQHITSFRSKEAKQLLNRSLHKIEINFMHCAFRYRGKANYRDPLYLAYGTQIRRDYAQFLHNLAVSARFAFIVGLTFAERAYGREIADEFLQDLERNFKGSAAAIESEIFWRSFDQTVLQPS